MKLASKELKRLVSEYNEIKEKKSELEKQEKAIKAQVLAHLQASNAESVAVGDVTCKKKVTSHSFKVALIGVKVTAAVNDLTKKLLEDGKNNLLSINPKATLLHQLQEENDQYTLDLLKGLGLEVEENIGIDIK
jgi:hypothetical protein